MSGANLAMNPASCLSGVSRRVTGGMVRSVVPGGTTRAPSPTRNRNGKLLVSPRAGCLQALSTIRDKLRE